MAERFNILYIHSHDTGRYIEPYGYNVRTGNMLRLAKEGVLFRQAFNGGPTCSPSRAALLTGQCPHSSGMLGLAHRGFSLNDYKQHLIHQLKPLGYHTALYGVQHVADHGGEGVERIGYDEVGDVGFPAARNVVPGVVDFLNREHDKPFFLSVGFFETHRPYPSAGGDEDARYMSPPAPLPDTAETRKDMAEFVTSARHFDTGVGQVLEALEARGLAENTLVICTTDHGIAFPQMKCHLTDHGIGVMLLMRGPGGFSGGKVIDGMVSHIDIFPTVCELLEIDVPGWVQGRSIMPLVRGEADEVNEEIFSEVTYHAAYEPQRAVRTTRWKYIKRFDEREKVVLPNCDDGYSKEMLMGYGLAERDVAQEQLYDLVYDPNEAHNLAGDGRYAEVLKEMQGRLGRWMERTDDPLLKGAIHHVGAIVNDADGVSPREAPRVLECP